MKGIIINQDTDGILKGIGHPNAPYCTASDIENFVKEFEGTQITDYFIAVYSTVAAYPSKVCTDKLDKYHVKEEQGVPVDYSRSSTIKGAHHAFEVLGVDPHQIMIDGFKKIGINPWLSYRMNDFHYRELETSGCFSEFYYKHPEVRRVKFHPEFTQSNADHAYDYYYDIVRDHIKSVIDESLDRYDVYGIELDFQREIHLFGMGRDHLGIEIMNNFIREVDEIIHKYEEKYAHEIKLAVHIASDVQTNFDFGLDVVKWAREGLVDMIIPSGRFSSADNNMPIRQWKSLLEPYGTIVAAGLDWRLAPYQYEQSIDPTIETFAAFAANAYEQGADKIYFYNYFRSRIWEHMDREAEFVTDPSLSPFDLPVYWTVINKLGDPETIMDLNRHHIITYSDTAQFWVHNGMNRQLPVTFPGTRGRGFKIGVGKLPENAKLTVRFGVEDGEKTLANIPRVFANSEPCEYVGNLVDEKFTKYRLFCYDVPETAFDTVIYPYIIGNREDATDSVTVHYVDLLVKIEK